MELVQLIVITLGALAGGFVSGLVGFVFIPLTLSYVFKKIK